jgi:hypothetical protein
MSRRDQIRMSPAEVAAFLEEERTVTCATLGPRGWPHLMPLWYLVRETPGDGKPPGERFADGAPSEPGPRLWAWTYATSQKVRNLERDPRATLQVEAGESYEQLRGVMLECDVVVHREPALIKAFGHELFRRYGAPRGQPPLADLPKEVGEMLDKQAAKRVALEFVERCRASWDHRKLGGVY